MTRLQHPVLETFAVSEATQITEDAASVLYLSKYREQSLIQLITFLAMIIRTFSTVCLSTEKEI